MITIVEVKEAYEVCKMQLEALGIKTGNVINIGVSKSLPSYLGVTNRKKQGNDYTFELEFNKAIKDKIVLYNVMVHELLHTIQGGFDHKTNGTWSREAKRVNKFYGYNITRTENAKNTLDYTMYPYVFKCEKCGQVFCHTRKTKMVKNPNSFSCGICHGKIERVK